MTDEKMANYPFERSEQLLKQALKHIPLGTQTFSKSTTQLPRGVSPLYASRASGSRLWDVDGNEYLDFVNALCAVTLGYKDPDVEKAVHAQMENGVLFSLPTEIEIRVAEKLCEMVPCAEKVRFGKNGSDATSGAVRLARAYTGRTRVATCGYHGWQDWFIGTTPRNLGVPEVVSELTHTFAYNDLPSLLALFRKWPGEFAGVIMEPMNQTTPEPGFLEGIQALCREEGAVFIFDEMITGFRFGRGGAQELFGVVPDLATFGKGLANGYPLSAIAGREEIMRLMEDIFFSFTMGSEALSLAAASATMEKISREPVVDKLHKLGEGLIERLNRLLKSHAVEHIFELSGHPSWSFIRVADVPPYSNWEIRTMLLQEMFAHGILILGTHNLSYAHSEEDLNELLEAYDLVLPRIRNAVANQTLLEELRCEPLVPLFEVRRSPK